MKSKIIIGLIILCTAFTFKGVYFENIANATNVLQPTASNTVLYSNSKASIDASNISEGYVMVKYTQKTNKRIKCIIKKENGTSYTYNVNNNGEYETFPLTEGNGKYTITVYENITGTKYSVSYSTTIDVKISNEFSPFLYPNQYVNFNSNSNVVSIANEITKNNTDDLEKLKSIYYYVINNITYDKQKAETVESGYLPNPDEIIMLKKGICFDYAAVMASMLRSQNIPCKLVIGYTGNAYHAWINVYIEGKGWIDQAVYFDGESWKLMDPTFASSGKNSASIQKYIGDGKNYTAKYAY